MLVLLVVSCCLVAVAEGSKNRSMRGTHRKGKFSEKKRISPSFDNLVAL